MANEQKAKSYELITACALKAYHGESFPITREHKFPGVRMRTDVVIGPLDSPVSVAMVTHSGSEVDYTKKLPRDTAELVELACEVPTLRSTALVIYDDHVLPGLIGIAKTLFGVVLEMAQHPRYRELRSLAERKETADISLNTKSDEDVQLATDRLSALIGIHGKSLLAEIGAYIGKAIAASENSSKGSLSTAALALVRSRAHSPDVKSYRHTRVRRGVGKLALFTQDERQLIYGRKALTGEYSWAESLGLVRKTLSGKNQPSRYMVADPEIVSGEIDGVSVEGVLSSLSLQDVERCIATATDKSALYIQRIRNSKYLDGAKEFVLDKLPDLKRQAFMSETLASVYKNPYFGISDFLDTSNEVTWHWLYTYLVALFKAVSGKKQGFGTTVIANLSGERRFRMQNSILSTLEYRQSGFDKALFDPLAVALSTALKSIDKSQIEEIHSNAIAQQLRNELEDKHLCHSINPLPVLCKHYLDTDGIKFEERRERSSMAEAAEAKGNAGFTKFIETRDALIWWRSAHDRTNVSHKKKELQTKALGLKIEWVPSSRSFAIKKNAKQLFLVVDGDFEADDFAAMSGCGWDSFFYADEIPSMIASLKRS